MSFDNISHRFILQQLAWFPAIQWIKLKAGYLERGDSASCPGRNAPLASGEKFDAVSGTLRPKGGVTFPSLGGLPKGRGG
jgi:hypothetical protein